MSSIGQFRERRRGPARKLSASQAAEVMRAHQTTDVSVGDIAQQFGVTRQTIYNVLRRLREGQSS